MISVSILELLISNTITFIIFFVYTFRYIQHKKTQIVTKVEFFYYYFLTCSRSGLCFRRYKIEEVGNKFEKN